MDEIQINHGGKLSLTERFEKIQGVRITNNRNRGGKTLKFIPGPKVANSRF
jgi:hypothetical protein